MVKNRGRGSERCGRKFEETGAGDGNNGGKSQADREVARPREDRQDGLAKMVDFAAGLSPRYREDLRYRTEGGRLRNHLTKRVPVIGARTATEVSSRLLARHGLSRNDIAWWAVHPGGTVVLPQVAKELELAGEALRFSYNVFENYGNMSSPSVLFVLREILDSCRPQPGQKGMLLSFGVGLPAFAALIEFASHEIRKDQNHG